MNQERKITKEIKLDCPTCQTIYQLLEIEQGNSDNCRSKCWDKWQQTLTDHHSKELVNYLNNEEEDDNE